jgi:enoyl-CoA hydratase/carnithine racemase
VTDQLALTIDGDLAVLELARPEKRNALNLATIAGLLRFFEAPPAGVRAVVLCGRGSHFSAGLDLSEMTERDVQGGIEHSKLWHRSFEAIEFGALPVVSALHGAVIGGGLELAAATHVRVADATAFYALPEGRRGLFVGGGGSVRLPRLIGVARVMDMILTGRTYDAHEGAAIGLSQYVVEAGGARTKALELARLIATNAPLSNFAVLQGLPRIADAPRAAGYFTESVVASLAQGDTDAKSRIGDFLEKRAPKVIP